MFGNSEELEKSHKSDIIMINMQALARLDIQQNIVIMFSFAIPQVSKPTSYSKKKIQTASQAFYKKKFV